MTRRKPVSLPLLLALGCAVVLPACLGIKKDYPTKHAHVLEAPRPDRELPPAQGPILQVRAFRASPGYDATGFLYRENGTEIERDFYEEFFVAPQAMIGSAAGLWLRDAGLFRAVVLPGGLTQPTHILDGALVVLYADWREGDTPVAVLELQVALSDVYGGGSPEFLRTYEQREPVRGDAPSDRVDAWNAALARALAAVEEDVRSALDTWTPRG